MKQVGVEIHSTYNILAFVPQIPPNPKVACSSVAEAK